LALKAFSRTTSFKIFATSKACLKVLIIYMCVLEMCKWCSKPCRDDLPGKIYSHSSGGLVPTKAGMLKRHIENDTSASQGGDLTWVPLKLNTRGVSFFDI
jgi:hypothetical protein